VGATLRAGTVGDNLPHPAKQTTVSLVRTYPEPVKIIVFAYGDCPVGTPDIESPHRFLLLQRKRGKGRVFPEDFEFPVSESTDVIWELVIALPEFWQSERSETHRLRPLVNGFDFPAPTC
jgi:hypothetical protein